MGFARATHATPLLIDAPCPAAIPVARETAMANDKERVALGSIGGPLQNTLRTPAEGDTGRPS